MEWEESQILSQTESKLSQSWVRIESKGEEIESNGVKMESTWSSNRIKRGRTGVKWSRKWVKWSQNGVKMESKWSPTECCLRKYEIQYLILKCCLKLKKCLRHQKVQFEELWSLTSLLEKAKKKIHACYEVKRQVNERWWCAKKVGAPSVDGIQSHKRALLSLHAQETPQGSL